MFSCRSRRSVRSFTRPHREPRRALRREFLAVELDDGTDRWRVASILGNDEEFRPSREQHTLERADGLVLPRFVRHDACVEGQMLLVLEDGIGPPRSVGLIGAYDDSLLPVALGLGEEAIDVMHSSARVQLDDAVRSRRRVRLSELLHPFCEQHCAPRVLDDVEYLERQPREISPPYRSRRRVEVPGTHVHLPSHCEGGEDGRDRAGNVDRPRTSSTIWTREHRDARPMKEDAVELSHDLARWTAGREDVPVFRCVERGSEGDVVLLGRSAPVARLVRVAARVGTACNARPRTVLDGASRRRSSPSRTVTSTLVARDEGGGSIQKTRDVLADSSRHVSTLKPHGRAVAPVPVRIPLHLVRGRCTLDEDAGSDAEGMRVRRSRLAPFCSVCGRRSVHSGSPSVPVFGGVLCRRAFSAPSIQEREIGLDSLVRDDDERMRARMVEVLVMRRIDGRASERARHMVPLRGFVRARLEEDALTYRASYTQERPRHDGIRRHATLTTRDGNKKGCV